MKKLPNLLLTLLLALAFTVPAVAESDGNLNGYPIQRGIYEGQSIRIWTPWAPDEQPKAAVEFSEYTGLEIIYENVPFGDDENAGDYRQAFINAMAAGSGPDVVHAANFAIPLWAKKNLVMPWDEYVDFSQGFGALNMTGAIENLFKYEDQYYAVADETAPLWNSSVIFYSKSAFENAGLDDPYELFLQGKWDWQTLASDCQKLTYDGGSGATDHYGMATWLTGEQFVASNGGEAVKIIDGKATYSLNSPESVFALNFMIENMPQSPSTAEQGPDAYFANGSAAMYYEGWWYVDDAREIYGDDLGLVPFPNGPDYDETPSRDYGEWCWAYMLTTAAKYPQAAADYFCYLFFPKDNAEPEDYTVWGGKEAYEEILGWAANTAMDSSRSYGDLRDVLLDSVWYSIEDDTPANLVESVAQEAQSIIDDAMQ